DSACENRGLAQKRADLLVREREPLAAASLAREAAVHFVLVEAGAGVRPENLDRAANVRHLADLSHPPLGYAGEADLDLAATAAGQRADHVDRAERGPDGHLRRLPSMLYCVFEEVRA